MVCPEEEDAALLHAEEEIARLVHRLIEDEGLDPYIVATAMFSAGTGKIFARRLSEQERAWMGDSLEKFFVNSRKDRTRSQN